VNDRLWQKVSAMPGFDPGRVKTPKGRLQRGIVFYRCRDFRGVDVDGPALVVPRRRFARVFHLDTFRNNPDCISRFEA
jgi:hypothetical protein